MNPEGKGKPPSFFDAEGLREPLAQIGRQTEGSQATPEQDGQVKSGQGKVEQLNRRSTTSGQEGEVKSGQRHGEQQVGDANSIGQKLLNPQQQEAMHQINAITKELPEKANKAFIRILMAAGIYVADKKTGIYRITDPERALNILKILEEMLNQKGQHETNRDQLEQPSEQPDEKSAEQPGGQGDGKSDEQSDGQPTQQLTQNLELERQNQATAALIIREKLKKIQDQAPEITNTRLPEELQECLRETEGLINSIQELLRSLKDLEEELKGYQYILPYIESHKQICNGVITQINNLVEKYSQRGDNMRDYSEVSSQLQMQVEAFQNINLGLINILTLLQEGVDPGSHELIYEKFKQIIAQASKSMTNLITTQQALRSGIASKEENPTEPYDNPIIHPKQVEETCKGASKDMLDINNAAESLPNQTEPSDYNFLREFLRTLQEETDKINISMSNITNLELIQAINYNPRIILGGRMLETFITENNAMVLLSLLRQHIGVKIENILQTNERIKEKRVLLISNLNELQEKIMDPRLKGVLDSLETYIDKIYKLLLQTRPDENEK